MKCKTQKDIQNPEVVQTAKGGYMAKGICECGCKMCAMLSKEKAEKAINEGVKKSF